MEEKHFSANYSQIAEGQKHEEIAEHTNPIKDSRLPKSCNFKRKQLKPNINSKFLTISDPKIHNMHKQ